MTLNHPPTPPSLIMFLDLSFLWSICSTKWANMHYYVMAETADSFLPCPFPTEWSEKRISMAQKNWQPHSVSTLLADNFRYVCCCLWRKNHYNYQSTKVSSYFHYKQIFKCISIESWPSVNFHQLGPLGRVGLVVAMSVCLCVCVSVWCPLSMRFF